MALESWTPERRTAALAHSVVNGAGVVALSCLHIWGELSADYAAVGILALCGIWVNSTRKGPPTGPTGAAGVFALLSSLPALSGLRGL